MTPYQRNVLSLLSQLHQHDPKLTDEQKLKNEIVAFRRTFLETVYGQLVLSTLINQAPLFKGTYVKGSPEESAFLAGKLEIVNSVIEILLMDQSILDEPDQGEDIDDDL